MEKRTMGRPSKEREREEGEGEEGEVVVGGRVGTRSDCERPPNLFRVILFGRAAE